MGFDTPNPRDVWAQQILSSLGSTTNSSLTAVSGAGQRSFADLGAVPSSVTLEAKVVGTTAGTVDADATFDVSFDQLAGAGGENTPNVALSSGSTFTNFSGDWGTIDLRDEVVINFRIGSDGTNTVEASNGGVAFRYK